MLFSDQRKHNLSLPANDESQNPSSVAFLIRWLCENLMKDPRKEMFVLEGAMSALSLPCRCGCVDSLGVLTDVSADGRACWC